MLINRTLFAFLAAILLLALSPVNTSERDLRTACNTLATLALEADRLQHQKDDERQRKIEFTSFYNAYLRIERALDHRYGHDISQFARDCHDIFTSLHRIHIDDNPGRSIGRISPPYYFYSEGYGGRIGVKSRTMNDEHTMLLDLGDPEMIDVLEELGVDRDDLVERLNSSAGASPLPMVPTIPPSIDLPTDLPERIEIPISIEPAWEPPSIPSGRIAPRG